MNNLVIICAILLLVLLFLKVPVYIAVLSASAVYFIGTPGMNLSIFAQKTISGAEGLSLLAIPFFVCAGIFMNYTGVTKRIMNCCEVLTAGCPEDWRRSTSCSPLSWEACPDPAWQTRPCSVRCWFQPWSQRDIQSHFQPSSQPHPAWWFR